MTAAHIAAFLALALGAPELAVAAPQAAPAGAPAKLSGDSSFKDLVANPKAKDLLYARIPLIMQVFDMGLFPDVATLKQVAQDEQAQTAGGFTPDVYQQLLKDLAAL